MSSLRPFSAFLAFATPLVALPVPLAAAPPPALAAFVGEWGGDSAQAGDARRYWTEGDLVRGEIVVSSGGELRVQQVTMLARPVGFLKVLTPEGGAAETFLGVATEGGIAWIATSEGSSQVLERVSGEGDARRLETMFAEGSGAAWRVRTTLRPAAALSGVIGGDVPAVERVDPVVLPSQQELALLDRLAALLAERSVLRTDRESLARELAGAWQEIERETSAIRTLKEQLVAATAALETRTATDSGAVAAAEARVNQAEAKLASAEQWAARLEENLEAAASRADAAAGRVRTLEAEVASLREGGAESAGALASLRAEAARLDAAAKESETRIAELTRERGTLAASLATAEAGMAALTGERDALAAAARQAPDTEEHRRLAGRLEQAEARLADSEARRLEMQARLESAANAESEGRRLAGVKTALESRLQSQGEELAAHSAQVEALEERVRSLTSSADRRVELEQALNTARADLAQATARATDLEARLAETRAEAQRSSERDRRLEEDLGAARDRLRELDALQAATAVQLAGLERERAGLASQLETLTRAAPDARIASLETRLADTYARAEARQARIERLEADLAATETERAALARRLDEVAAPVAPPAPAVVANGEADELRRRLAASEATRRQLESEAGALAARIREMEARLAAATELRRPLAQAAPPVPAPVSAVPAPPAEDRVLFRMPQAEPAWQAPTRPAEPVVRPPPPAAPVAAARPPNPLVAQTVRGLVLEGYRGSGSSSIIVVGGRPYRAGAVLEGTGGLRFVRIDGRQLVFAGADGAEYRREP